MADKRKENMRNYSGYSRSVDSDIATKKKTPDNCNRVYSKVS